MRWTGKLAVVAVVGLMALPTAYTMQQQPVLSGHATYAAMDGFDPCIGAIAGIVRLRIMWFNDQVLFERSSSDGGSWVYAVESGFPDPRDQTLAPTGQVFEFVDPNGVDWRVTEYAYTVSPTSMVDGGQYNLDPNRNPPARVERYPSANTTQGTTTVHTWVVETGPTIEDFAATGRPYNFVNLVDTCKFNAQGTQVHHGNDGGGNWTSDWPDDPTFEDHYAQDPSHGHGGYQVDLYVGKAPRVEFLHEQDPEYLGVAT